MRLFPACLLAVAAPLLALPAGWRLDACRCRHEAESAVYAAVGGTRSACCAAKVSSRAPASARGCCARAARFGNTTSRSACPHCRAAGAVRSDGSRRIALATGDSSSGGLAEPSGACGGCEVEAPALIAWVRARPSAGIAADSVGSEGEPEPVADRDDPIVAAILAAIAPELVAPRDGRSLDPRTCAPDPAAPGTRRTLPLLL